MNIFALQLSAYLAVGLWQILAIYLITDKDEPLGPVELFLCMIGWPIVWMMMAPLLKEIPGLLMKEPRVTIKVVITNGAISILLIVLFRFLITL